MVSRRELLALLPAGVAALAAPWALPGCADTGVRNAPERSEPSYRTEPRYRGTLPDDAALLADLEERTFRYFWETANPANGLSPDRWPGSAPMASVASVGFALTAYVIGVERGYISRADAAQRVLATMRFFHDAPQGPAASGMTGHHGFFYHFLHMQTGSRFNQHVELSTIDTALLLGGMLHAQGYFDRSDAAEAEIRQRVDAIYGRVDWPWVQRRAGFICMGWTPEAGFDRFIDYTGYDEAMLLVLLALGSPTRPADDATWTNFTRTYSRSWGGFMGQEHLGGGPLFFHQYSHVWIDFKGLQDDYMRQRGLDYFENSRRATVSQRAYATLNPAAGRTTTRMSGA